MLFTRPVIGKDGKKTYPTDKQKNEEFLANYKRQLKKEEQALNT